MDTFGSRARHFPDKKALAAALNEVLAEGRLDVAAEPIQQGRTQQLWQVLLTRTDDGKLVARGQVRLQNVPLPGVG